MPSYLYKLITLPGFSGHFNAVVTQVSLVTKYEPRKWAVKDLGGQEEDMTGKEKGVTRIHFKYYEIEEQQNQLKWIHISNSVCIYICVYVYACTLLHGCGCVCRHSHPCM